MESCAAQGGEAACAFVFPWVCGVARHWQSAQSEDVTRPLFRLVGLWFKGKRLSYQLVVTTGTSSCKGVWYDRPRFAPSPLKNWLIVRK